MAFILSLHCGREGKKGVQYRVIEGDLTLDGEHIMQYIGDIVEMYT